MAPTINPGEKLMIDKLAYIYTAPKRFDIIAFNPPPVKNVDTNGVFIMRVVGLPGESIVLHSNYLVVDGQTIELPLKWKTGDTVSTNGFAVTNMYSVPSNAYFVVGDNRAIAYDSRYWGAVRRDAIIGKASLLEPRKGQ